MIFLSRLHSRIWLSLLAAFLFTLTEAAWASPPFDANDAMITDTGHLEVFIFNEFSGLQSEYAGATGVDMTYGINDSVQIGLVLPIGYEHSAGSRLQAGFGDIEINSKIKLLKQESAGITLSIEPTMTIPSAKAGFGAGKVSAFFPVWAQHDMGKWSLYGGGGYRLNPGIGSINNWTGSVVLTHDMSEKLMLGIEASREGPDAIGVRPSSALRLGGSYHLSDHAALLFSGGPRFNAAGGPAEYHGYFAILLNF